MNTQRLFIKIGGKMICNKNYFYLIILILFIWGCQTSTQKELPVDKPKVIAFLGSSVCKYTGDEEELGYAGRFGRRIDTANWKYVNVSRGGINTIRTTPRLTSHLYPQNPDYVVIGLSLSNEGITKPLTVEGRYRILERFRTGLLRLSDSIRAHGAVPVIANCYPRGSFDEKYYLLTREMNAIINEWAVPSINLLGAVEDGTGKWAKGYDANEGHPNKFGHEEMSRAFAPTLFDALDAGKLSPYRNWTSDYMQFFDIQKESQVLQVTVDSLVHSFAESFMFRTTGDGLIGSVKLQNGNCTIEVKDGIVIYKSEVGTTSIPLPDEGLESWNYLTLSHAYARGETCLFLNGKKSMLVKEKLKPKVFSLGGFANNTIGVTDTLCIKDWMIHRSSLTEDEAKDYMKWKMLRSSLEVYVPLVCDSVKAGSEIENKAQSFTKVLIGKEAKFNMVKIGMKKKL